MAKPVILAGKREGRESYTLLNGPKPISFTYDSKKTDRSTFIDEIGKEFAMEIDSRGFYEQPKFENGFVLIGSDPIYIRRKADEVDLSQLERVLDAELSHFSDEAIVELKKLKRAS